MLHLKNVVMIICVVHLVFASAHSSKESRSSKGSKSSKGKSNTCHRKAIIGERCDKKSGGEGVCQPPGNCKGNCRLRCVEPLPCSPVLPTVLNGFYTLDIAGNTQEGATATLNCSTGYQPSSPTIICEEGSTWSLQGTCNPVECSNDTLPENPEFGTWGTDGDSTYNTLTYLCCEEGYYVDGGYGCVQCQSNGTWSSSTATCTPIKGYYVNGGHGCAQYQANGTWSSSTDICTPINCGIDSCTDFQLVPNVEGESFVGSTASVLCIGGFTPEYDNATCLLDGTWAIPDDACSVAPTALPSTPETTPFSSTPAAPKTDTFPSTPAAPETPRMTYPPHIPQVI